MLFVGGGLFGDDFAGVRPAAGGVGPGLAHPMRTANTTKRTAKRISMAVMVGKRVFFEKRPVSFFDEHLAGSRVARQDFRRFNGVNLSSDPVKGPLHAFSKNQPSAVVAGSDKKADQTRQLFCRDM